MGDYRAYDPTRQARRPQAHDRCARDFERHFLRAVDGLPMAGAAQGPATEEHGMGLFRSMDLGMVRWSAFITRFMWRYASRRDGRQARPQRSSTARVPRARKKGGRAR